MLWVALGLLGIPLWFILGALLSVLLSPHHFKKQPGVCTVKIRTLNGNIPGIRSKWRRLYIRVLHDVLLITHGTALFRTVPLGISRFSGEPAEGGERQDHLIRLWVDGGAVLELRADTKCADMLQIPIRKAQDN